MFTHFTLLEAENIITNSNQNNYKEVIPILSILNNDLRSHPEDFNFSLNDFCSLANINLSIMSNNEIDFAKYNIDKYKNFIVNSNKSLFEKENALDIVSNILKLDDPSLLSKIINLSNSTLANLILNNPESYIFKSNIRFRNILDVLKSNPNEFEKSFIKHQKSIFLNLYDSFVQLEKSALSFEINSLDKEINNIIDENKNIVAKILSNKVTINQQLGEKRGLEKILTDSSETCLVLNNEILSIKDKIESILKEDLLANLISKNKLNRHGVSSITKDVSLKLMSDRIVEISKILGITEKSNLKVSSEKNAKTDADLKKERKKDARKLIGKSYVHQLTDEKKYLSAKKLELTEAYDEINNLQLRINNITENIPFIKRNVINTEELIASSNSEKEKNEDILKDLNTKALGIKNKKEIVLKSINSLQESIENINKNKLDSIDRSKALCKSSVTIPSVTIPSVTIPSVTIPSVIIPSTSTPSDLPTPSDPLLSIQPVITDTNSNLLKSLDSSSILNKDENKHSSDTSVIVSIFKKGWVWICKVFSSIKNFLIWLFSFCYNNTLRRLFNLFRKNNK